MAYGTAVREVDQSPAMRSATPSRMASGSRSPASRSMGIEAVLSQAIVLDLGGRKSLRSRLPSSRRGPNHGAKFPRHG